MIDEDFGINGDTYLIEELKDSDIDAFYECNKLSDYILSDEI